VNVKTEMANHEGRGLRKPWWLLISAAILYLAAFAYTLERPEVREMGDSQEYLRAAENLLSHGVLYSGNLEDAGPIDPALYSRRPPLYPLLLAFSEAIGGGTLVAVLIQMLMTGAGAWLTWRTARYLGLSRGASILVVALFLYFPAQVIYSQVVMSEILFQFLLVAGIFFLVRYARRRAVPDLYLWNFLLGASVLCKPVMMFFWIPNLAFCLWWYWRLRVRHLLVAALIPFLIISAWSYRNYRLTGSYHFSSMGTAYLRLLTRDRLQDETGPPQELGKRSVTTITRFLSEVPQRLPGLARGYAIGVSAFFLDPGRFDWYEFFNLPHSRSLRRILFTDEEPVARRLKHVPIVVLLALAIVFVVNLAVLVGVAHALFVVRDYSPEKVFIVMLVLYLAAVTSFAGASRYRLPVESLLLLLAAPFLWRITEQAAKLLRTRKA